MYYSVGPIYGFDEDVVYEEIEYMGHQILACKTENGYVVERIYSTDPKDFLCENLYPGKMLENALIKYNFE